MHNRKSLSLQIAGAIALTTLFGTSAFAESRHHSETSRGSGGHIDRSGGARSSAPSVQRDHSVTRTETRSAGRGFWRGNDAPRNATRDFSQRDHSSRSISPGSERRDWSNNSQRYDSRNNQRGVSADRFRNVEGWRPGSRAPYANHERVTSYGRVDRYERWHGGYRVWIGGGLFPIFVPFERWRLFPLHVGLSIRFGGYWDPLGYWSVYDYSPYDGYYGGYYRGYYGGGYYDRYDTAYTRGEIRGVVESVDFRRGTMVLNDDISRQFVTVTMPRDRRMDEVRPGDYVEFSGDWTRSGLFEAYRLERFDEGRDDRRY